MQRERLPHILIPIAALIAIIPLLIHGCSCGHDFDFHLLNWLEAARQFGHGNLHPHWAFTPAYNAGEPRFVFYPPLSWTIGAILGLIFPWTWTPILYTWLALTAAGLSLYYLARNFTPPTAATFAALLYIANPYMLFTAYERTAYAELLAATFIPLLLHAILRSEVTIPRIAIPIALLWLSNAPAAVMSCYTLALLALIRLLRPSEQSRKAIALNAVAGTILGLTLAAFYILPAAYERRFVQIAMATNIPIYQIQNNFLFHQTADSAHDQVLHTASIIAVTLITATLLILLYQFAKKPGGPSFAPFAKGGVSRTSATPTAQLNQRHLLYSLAILTITITLLQTPLTQPIWNHAPELAFLQFPWRFLAILAAVLALAVALAIKPIQLKPATIAPITVIVAATLTLPAYRVFRQSCDPEDTVPARVALFHSNQGTDPTDEYTPTTADNDSLANNNPPYWLAPHPTDCASSVAPVNQCNENCPTPKPGQAPSHLTLNTSKPEFLILNLRDYPSWSLTLNGSPAPNREKRDDGLIAIPIPAGPSTIYIIYTQTLDQTIGDLISFASLATLVLILLHNRRKERRLFTATEFSAPNP